MIPPIYPHRRTEPHNEVRFFYPAKKYAIIIKNCKHSYSFSVYMGEVLQI